MTLPQTNATLTAVHGPGASAHYGQPAAAGAQKWAGRAGVYLRQRDERVTTGQASSVVITRTLLVPAEIDVDWTEGDTLSLSGPGVPATVTVRGVEPFHHPTAPGETRLVLEDA